MKNALQKLEIDFIEAMQLGKHLLFQIKFQQFKMNPKNKETNLPKKIQETIQNFLPFIEQYYLWYTPAKLLIKRISPYMLADFVRTHEPNINRKQIMPINFTLEDYLLANCNVSKDLLNICVVRMDQQVNIVRSCLEQFFDSIFDIAKCISAELHCQEIIAARELLKNSFPRAAGVIAGAVLENHLLQTCRTNNIEGVGTSPTSAKLSRLLKQADFIDATCWLEIQSLIDSRKSCDHGNIEEPQVAQIRELIDGVSKIVKTVL